MRRPERGDLYLTEDASGPNGLVYRFAPTDRSRAYGALRNGGRLEAMRCSQRATHVPDLSVFTVPGTTLDVEWVAVPIRWRPHVDPQAVRRQPRSPAAASSRAPGGATPSATARPVGTAAATASPRWPTSCARSPGRATARSPSTTARCGATTPSAGRSPSRCTCRVNPDPASDNPDGPDNITVSPYGGFFLAEDGDGVQHLLAVDDGGSVALFARNRLSSSEFTGVNFAPDGSALFANIQDQGISFAITGPFHNLG